MIESFDILIRKSYDFKQNEFVNNPRWGILRDLYNKNYIENIKRDYNVLPKKIHQIWLGGQIPDKYRLWGDTWKRFNPEWEYKLWTDPDVISENIDNRKLFDSLTNYGPKSDIFRYHLLNKYGGVYIDTDFECLKSFNELTYLSFFTGVGFPARVELYPGLVGCTPNHPIMQRIIGGVNDMQYIPNTPQGVLETISSYFFTRMFFSVVTEYIKGVVALPHDYFYPFPNNVRYTGNPYNYIKPCSYAVHHWEVSWVNKTKNAKRTI